MKKFKLMLLGITAGLALPMLGFTQDGPTFEASKSNGMNPIPGQYIVQLKESAAKPVIKQQKRNNDRLQKVKDNAATREKNMNKVKEVHGRHNISDSKILAAYGDVIVGFSAKLSNTEVAELKSDPDVEGVYQDYEISISDVPESIVSAEEAAPLAQTTPCGVTNIGGSVDGSTKATWIWILDTGIDSTHADLNVLSSMGKSFIAGEYATIDGKGHGTHCAGIAAAKNNTIGVIGVSAGAKVVPVKVLNNAGSGDFTILLNGLNYVAMYDIVGDVVSMSLGGLIGSTCTTYMPTLTTAVQNLGMAGTSVCIAAGNNASCTGATVQLPACINGTKVYTVASMDCQGVWSQSFSNGGYGTVDWVAVGSNVYSTYKGNSYATMSGTSMATPHVAGLIHSKGGAAPVSGGIIYPNLTGCTTVVYYKAKR